MNREFSAGGVVFKRLKGKIFWLVAKGTPGPDFPDNIWRLPKGWLDDKNEGRSPGPLASGLRKATQEEIKEAALKEVREEGGVLASILFKLGTEKYFLNFKGQRILKFVTFYLMEWERDLPEGFGWETQEVAWREFEDAKRKLSYKREKDVLSKANKRLNQPVQGSLV
ncbi:hypothetical protein A2V56_02530 [Candidatus Woesebacteria bacterium RBG_19FT_COMBO_42_9]|uniref:Nudix hydrolase domain-containing protein n=1 Tax=Candidatus Woesebacteria bacterium RBG_16_42_24 TaxID=1802485 RepID=A0A1F7XLB7_9BACT|nr:MAG: hypothetical protein A2V97_03345 [Candidatus Woesebacteria bacterium RBG_16_42_24]OGM16991.1 MAG: hypothetical protein A2V56_02530 [Candidatus Woesebacteria bacterium RBG_19FT_COMBO_42_9]OGM68431.1 MAG: hypothetical protein A2985_01360 [Candidatus Woesebacteria bacterium RIFCSPLOWO2_01_FULL_43_11]